MTVKFFLHSEQAPKFHTNTDHTVNVYFNIELISKAQCLTNNPPSITVIEGVKNKIQVVDPNNIIGLISPNAIENKTIILVTDSDIGDVIKTTPIFYYG